MAVKKIAWIDAVRVLSALFVIIDHYLKVFFGHCDFNLFMLTLIKTGNVGVFLFFAMSGYLIPASWERSSSIWEFYRRKLVRVVVPFTVAYIVFGAFLLFLGILNPEIAKYSTFFQAMYQGGSTKGVLLGMFPLELNLVKYFDIPYLLLVGEWFMGTIVVLFLLAPLLYQCAKRAPLLSLIISLALSVVTFYATQSLVDEGRILNSFWLPIVRIPEFLLGMLLFIYKDFFQKYKKKLLTLTGIFVLIVGTYFNFKYSVIGTPEFFIFPLDRLFYPMDPRSFILSFPTIYLCFNALEYLTEKLPKFFDWFNSFSDISYMIMLTHHVIIYIFANIFHVENFRKFGIAFLFPIAVITTIVLSREIQKYSDPVEKFFMPKRKT